jgi:hypothetical protein
MKRFSAVLILFTVFVLVSCGPSSSADDIPARLGAEVMKNMFDDGRSMAYLRVDHPSVGEEDAAIANIAAKKNEWEKKFPTKKLIAMSIVTGNQGGYGIPVVVGLLVSYEQK